MSFLFPGMLWALPLVAVPVILHLLNRQRYQRVDFGAMEFLRRAIRRTRRRVLLEDLILLMLRTLAVLLLILGLAGPTLGPGNLLSGNQPRGEVLVLDTSMSMERRAGGGSAYDRARSAARRLLRDLRQENGDRAALILAGQVTSRPAFGDPAEVRLALEESGDVEAGHAALAAALESARRTAEAMEQDNRLKPEITVFSDLQAHSWSLDGAVGEALQRLAVDGRALRLVDVGLPGGNTTVTALALEPAWISPGEDTQLSATIRRYGGPRRVRLTVLLDEVPVATETLDLGTDEEREFRTWLQPVETGSRSLALQLDTDELATDDRRQAILRVRDPLQVLLVGQSAPSNAADGVYESLGGFLDLGSEGPFELDRLDPSRVREERLAEAGVVVLADPGSITAEGLAALRQFVLAGGGLLLGLGPDTDPRAAARILEPLGAPPMVIGETATTEEPLSRLRILDADHPALRLFTDPRWQPLLTEVPFRRFRPLLPGDDQAKLPAVLEFVRGADSENASQGAAMVEWPLGSGRVTVLAAAPLTGWNFMGEVAAGTLPFLLDLVNHLAPRPRHPSVVEVGSPLGLDLPAPPTSLTLTGPDGRRRTPSDPATTQEGGRAQQPLLESAALPGVWTAQVTMLAADGLENDLVERLAVNPPASEGDPAIVDLALLQAALPPQSTLRGADQDGAAAPDESGLESRLDTHFFTLMAILLFLETLLAAWLDRRRG